MHEGEWRGIDRHVEHTSRIREVEKRPDISIEKLEDEVVAASREAEDRIVDIRKRIARKESIAETPREPVRAHEPERLNIFQQAYQSVKQSKLAKMLMVAAGLHVPMTPQGRMMIDRVVHGVESINPNWFKEGMVIHPQSEEKKAEVRAKIRERESRVDKKAIAEYEKKTSEQLAHGEHISFKRMYFDLERLHGVPAEEVAEAERKADSMIQRFSDIVGTSLDQGKIKRIVDEMYGPDRSHDDGQAVVSTYFVIGIHNCDSYARAEQIVFESLIEHLPESERRAFDVGETMEEGHVIATLTDRRGTEPRTYQLQPSFKILTGEKPEAGTTRVSADFLKKSTVASEIVAVAAAGKPGEVLPSPRIDRITNQAIPRGYIPTGRLKSSDFNYEQAQKNGLEPEPYVDTVKEPMQVEMLDERMKHERMNELVQKKYELAAKKIDFTTIPTGELHRPSVEDIRYVTKLMNKRDSSEYGVGGYKITSLDDWSEDAIATVLQSPVSSIEMNAARMRAGTVDRVTNIKISHPKDIRANTIVFGGIETIKHDGGTVFQHFSIEEFYKLLSQFDSKDRRIVIDYPTLESWEWDALKGLDAKTIDLHRVRLFHALIIGDNEGVDASVDTGKVYADEEQNVYVGKILFALERSGKKIIVDGGFFMNQVLRNDKVFDYKNVTPSFEDIERGQLAWFRSELLKKNHPRAKELIREIEYAIGRQNLIEVQVTH